MGLTNKIITDCHSIARYLAPKDTGNLSRNAIKIRNRTQNSFTLTYSATDAYYIGFVNEGTKHQPAQHFIENTVQHIVVYLNSVSQGKQPANHRVLTKAIASNDNELLQGNPDYRRFVHTQSIFQHYQTEGTDRLYRKRGD